MKFGATDCRKCFYLKSLEQYCSIRGEYIHTAPLDCPDYDGPSPADFIDEEKELFEVKEEP